MGPESGHPLAIRGVPAVLPALAEPLAPGSHSPAASFPELGLPVCAWGARSCLALEASWCKTVKALSCELLMRGRGGCKGYTQPRVCLRAERKGCCGKWPHRCSLWCAVCCLYNRAKWQVQAHSWQSTSGTAEPPFDLPQNPKRERVV